MVSHSPRAGIVPNPSTAGWTDRSESFELRAGNGALEGVCQSLNVAVGCLVGLGSMAHDALIDPLQRVALFQGLKALQIAEIARQAERIVFRPGDRIIEGGREADAAFLIVAGDAMRISGLEIQGAAERVPPGSLIGEMAMLIDTEHASTIIAEGQVRALKITRANLHEQMAADPSLAEHFMTKIIGRLHALAEELRSIDRALPSRAARAHAIISPRNLESVPASLCSQLA